MVPKGCPDLRSRTFGVEHVSVAGPASGGGFTSDTLFRGPRDALISRSFYNPLAAQVHPT